jgi:opacity protein-like surface antigen
MTDRSKSLDDITGVDVEGSVDSLSVTANLLYGFEVAVPVKPYVGAGLGGATVTANEWRVVGSPTIVVDDSDTAFACQFIVGADYTISEGLDAYVDYRLFGTSDLDMSQSGGPEFNMD